MREQEAADNGDAQRAAQLGAGALLQRQRQGPEQRGHGGHHDRAEAQQAGLVDGLHRRQPFGALGVERKVNHHDGVLLHDADQQDDADQRDQGKVLAAQQQREQRAHTRRRQARKDGDGMHVALVKHPQHDVDHDNGGEDEERLALERGLEFRGAAGEGRHDGIGQFDLLLRGLDGLDRRAQRPAGPQVEGQRHGRELALVNDRERGRGNPCFGKGAQRHHLARAGLDVDLIQRIRGELILRLHLQHDAVLVELGEDGGDLALAKGVVKRVVNGLGEHIQARSSLAVHLDADLQAAGLLVGGDIAQLWPLAEHVQEFGRPFRQFHDVGVRERVLVLGAADAAINLHVLGCLHEEGNALHRVRGGAQAGDDLVRAGLAAVARLEVDVEAAGVDGGVHAASADKGGHAHHVRVAPHEVGDGVLASDHVLEGDGLRGIGDSDDEAGVLGRQEALGYDDVEPEGCDQGDDRHAQGEGLMPQHPQQAVVIAIEHALEHPVGEQIQPPVLRLVFGLEQPRAHHRGERQGDDGRDCHSGAQGDGEFLEQPAHDAGHE